MSDEDRWVNAEITITVPLDVPVEADAFVKQEAVGDLMDLIDCSKLEGVVSSGGWIDVRSDPKGGTIPLAPSQQETETRELLAREIATFIGPCREENAEGERSARAATTALRSTSLTLGSGGDRAGRSSMSTNSPRISPPPSLQGAGSATRRTGFRARCVRRC